MKYLLLIHHREASTPNEADAWEKLSPDEQREISEAYQAINQSPASPPAFGCSRPRRRRPCACRTGAR